MTIPLYSCVTKDPINLQNQNVHIARAAFLKGKNWKNGSTIKIAFIKDSFTFNNQIIKNSGYTPDKAKWVQKIVEKYLLPNINLSFTWDVDIQNSDVRISFVPEMGAFSELGTDALTVPKDQTTLNLGWLDNDTDYDDIDYKNTGVVVVHEFGHLLGMIHEHQRGDSDKMLEWNKPVVYKALGAPPNSWDKETVDSQVFTKYSVDSFNGSKFDRYSVMEYYFQDNFFINSPDLKHTKYLSNLDICWINKTYPGKPLPKGLNTDCSGTNPYGGSTELGSGNDPSNKSLMIWSITLTLIIIFFIILYLI